MILSNNIVDFFNGNIFSQYVSIGVLLFIVHMILVGIYYMVAKFFKNHKMEAHAKNEFGNAVFSIVLIFGFTTAILIINNLFCIGLSSTGYSAGGCISNDLGFTTHLAVARAHLGANYNNLRVLALGMLRILDWKITGESLNLGMGLVSVKPFVYQKYDIFAYGTMYDLLTKTMFFEKFLEIFLLIGGYYLFPLLMALGLIFRILPFTRKLGGLLLAIAISIFYIMPYLYIFSKMVIDAQGDCFNSKFILENAQYQVAGFSLGNVVIQDDYKDADEMIAEEIKRINKNNYNVHKADVAILKVLKENVGNTITTSSGLETGKINDPDRIGLFNRNSKINSACSNMDPSVLQVVAFIITSFTFSAIFVIVGTLSSIYALSPMLGGDTSIAGLGRLL